MLKWRQHNNIFELKSDWGRFDDKVSLFSSWPWCLFWWEVWGAHPGFELHLYSFYTDSGSIVAIAPFFIVSTRNNWGVSNKQLQIIGNYYPTGLSVLSEYSDILAKPEYEDEVSDCLIRLLAKLEFDELVVPYTTNSSFLYKWCESNKSAFRYIEKIYEGDGTAIDVAGDYADYLGRLGKNTRLKAFNRRVLFSRLGEALLEYADEHSIDEYLSQLNALGKLRWGRNIFRSQSLDFHRRLAINAYAAGGLKLSRLKLNGEVVSVLYNIKFGAVEYNIQAAYIEDFHSKLSLGSLHLGYAIASAFDSRTIHVFDLLFGRGKNDAYKNRYKGQELQFYSFFLGKTFKSLILYQAANLFKRLKKMLKQFFPGANNER